MFSGAILADERSVSSGSRTPSPFSGNNAGTTANGGLSASQSTPPSGVQESYSRKVFVGGLPPDIDQGMLQEREHVNGACIIGCRRTNVTCS